MKNRGMSVRNLSQLLAVAVAGAGSAQGAVTYTITAPVGFFDSSSTVISHVGASGPSAAYVKFNALGQSVGTSRRYQPSSNTTNPNKDAGVTGWFYDPALKTTTQIGLTVDSPDMTIPVYGLTYSYTSSTGYQLSQVSGISANGYAAGTSNVYNAATVTNFPSPTGTDAWVYNSASTSNMRIGLLDSDHYNAVGFKKNSVTAINAQGVVVGLSVKYSAANTTLGTDIFVYNPAGAAGNNSVKIGLTSANYVSAGGNVNNTVSGINDNGFVAGASANYPRASLGSSSDAWIYTPSTGLSTQIGTAPAGYSGDVVTGISNFGVIGYTNNPTISGVNSYWIYNIGLSQSKAIGFTAADSSDYSNGNGSTSNASQINNAGFVAGGTTLYQAYTTPGNGYYSAGQDAWIYGGTTQQVGLHTGAIYNGTGSLAVPISFTVNGHTNTVSSTLRYSAVSALAATGYAVGFSFRFQGVDSNNSSVFVGQDGWVFNPHTNVSTQVGLTGAGYQSSNGYNESTTANFVNSTGYAAGTTTRYIGTATAGPAAFVYTPGANNTIGTSNRVGLTGSDYTATDNAGNTYQQSAITAITSSGLVGGYSTRYYGQGVTVSSTSITATGSTGQDAWVLDTTTNTQTTLTFGANSVGYAFSTIGYVGENGLVLGTYNKYASTGTASLGTYLFAWTKGSGIEDLGTALVSDVNSAGWSKLASLYGVDANGDIFGYGTNTVGAAPFVLQLAIPEPMSISLLAAGLCGLAVRRRSRSK